MATKDYVKRGRSEKPASIKPASIKAKTNPKGKKAPTTGFPTKWAAVAVILVCGLITSLFLLSGTDVPDQTPATPAAIPIKPQQAKTNTNALPPKPEVKWSYIKELENKIIILPPLTPQQIIAKDKPIPPYVLQCGAFRSRPQANERKARIALRGFSSEIKIFHDDHGAWYQVVLGPFKNERLAMDDQNKLAVEGISPCNLYFWNGNN